jgi:hypothetical protein
MGKNEPDEQLLPGWTFDGLVQFTVMVIGLLLIVFLPILSRLLTADLTDLYWSGLGVGGLGVLLLFLARLPLYRQRRFFTLGSKALPELHRKLYKIAYGVVISSVLLLGIVWLRAR